MFECSRSLAYVKALNTTYELASCIKYTLFTEQFVDRLLTPEAASQPSDASEPEKLVFELPPWYDKEKFDRGRAFYWSHSYAIATSMLYGLVAVFAIPSILNVLEGSQRSSSVYTAYKRYLSTLLHATSWFETELKPGSTSWRSLYTVRSRHFRASLAAKLHGHGMISQRDLALTTWGFIGFSVLKPQRLGISALSPGDWDAYNHFWRVQSYMIGIEDKYNICQETIEETREVLQLILDRVYTPCLENVPEYFEHMSRVMLEGMYLINPTIDVEAAIYNTKYLADVPGYIYTESQRIRMQDRLREHLKKLNKPLDSVISSRDLVRKCEVEGLPDIPSKTFKYHDFDTMDSVPEYKYLNFLEKYRLNANNFLFVLNQTYLGRLFLNLNHLWALFLMKYCPYYAFFKFGIKKSLVDMFKESPHDDTKAKLNKEYQGPKPPLSWYKAVWGIIWQ